MKKHAIIPIFIPHEGCNNSCVFCNQQKITAKEHAPTIEETRKIIDTHLNTLKKMDLEIIEIAFYGGSFTGLDITKQSSYLYVAKEYKDRGEIDKIHLSTRPDYINKEILDNLKLYGVDIIELGVQSFDDEVLEKSKRGHSSKCIYESAELIKSYGFQLGIQLMIGLPYDSLDKCIYSAMETVKLKPTIARLYPVVIIPETELNEMYKNGTYNPLPLKTQIEWTKEMYKILSKNHIKIIRVGLKSSDIIMEEGSISKETFHPAFRQLVEGAIAKEKIDDMLWKYSKYSNLHIVIFANQHSLPNAVGLNGMNKKSWEEKYSGFSFEFKTDNELPDEEFQIKIKLDVTISDAAGNITAFVHNNIPQEKYGETASKLLSIPNTNIEQVAFIKSMGLDNFDGEIEMAGLEFCGNATRSFGLLVSNLCRLNKSQLKIKSSGSNELLTVDIDKKNNYAKLEMPSPKSITKLNDTEIKKLEDEKLAHILEHSTFVEFDGIFHVVLKDIPPSDRSFDLIKDYIKKEHDPLSIGAMFYDTKENFLTPMVYVSKVNSTFLEGSCCSGTTALAHVLSQSEKPGNYTYNIKEPGGTLICDVTKKTSSDVHVFIGSEISFSSPKNIII